MDKLNIAIAADENENMWKGHFGDAPVFLKFHVYRCGKCEFAGKQLNTKKDEDEQHGSETKMHSIKAMLNEFSCAAARVVSANFKKMAKNTEVQPVVVKNAENITAAVEKIISNYQQLNDMAVKRKNGEKDPVIPEI
ncbi:MAG: hypothetical protein ACLFP1_07290 [Candidatus Goldiibacteriota bacterium]